VRRGEIDRGEDAGGLAFDGDEARPHAEANEGEARDEWEEEVERSGGGLEQEAGEDEEEEGEDEDGDAEEEEGEEEGEEEEEKRSRVSLRPMTSAMLVYVSSCSAPPCSQSTLASESP